MSEVSRVRKRIALVVLSLSALAWSWLLLGSHAAHDHHAAHHAQHEATHAMPWSIDAIILWLVMLIAMMAPTVIEPMRHVWERSFKSRRLAAMLLFVIGYMAVWTVAGLFINGAITALRPLQQQAPVAVLWIGFAAVVIWQCAPIKQRCLNRNHNHSALRAFGMAANIDALHFGARHGYWCVGSCWALMSYPLLLDQGHLPVMLLATLLMWGESLESPTPPRWRWRGPGKLVSVLRWRLIGSRSRTFVPLSGKL